MHKPDPISPATVRHITDAARAFRDANYALGQAIEGLPVHHRIDLLVEQRRIKAALTTLFDQRLLPIVANPLLNPAKKGAR